MGHNIEAIVAKGPINEDKAREYKLAVAFEGDFVIVIVFSDSVLYWSDKLSLETESLSEELYDLCETTMHFARELGIGKFAYIKTDYFGGFGGQHAAIVEADGEIVVVKDINVALKEIGVVQHPGKDEFDSINLGEYRDTEYYYWNDKNNFALRVSNMIPGSIPDDFKWGWK